ncbi:MAG: D-alanine--D-alanine ligase [Proteobacteria bacterium]|nr:D-alanine--D-alanine ligase [Pseudomonadota bacterium]
MRKNGRIAVLMGGRSSEREISLQSGNAVLKALKAKGYHPVAIDLADPLEYLICGSFDKAYIALHGTFGEDGCVQGMLELLEIPYTGSGVLASASTMDKVFAKKMMLSEGIVTPRFMAFSDPRALTDDIDPDFDYPVIVKPVAEGSTFGVTKVEKSSELVNAIRETFNFGSAVLVERFIEGREVTVGLIDGETLPVVEVIPQSGFYDFEAKYTKGMTRYIVPAEIGDEMTKEVCRISRKVYNLFGCRGAARVDFILGERGPSVLEINTIPGMTETSLLPMAAWKAGMSFEDLVERIIDGAGLDNSHVLNQKRAKSKKSIRRVV